MRKMWQNRANDPDRKSSVHRSSRDVCVEFGIVLISRRGHVLIG